LSKSVGKKGGEKREKKGRGKGSNEEKEEVWGGGLLCFTGMGKSLIGGGGKEYKDR